MLGYSSSRSSRRSRRRMFRIRPWRPWAVELRCRKCCWLRRGRTPSLEKLTAKGVQDVLASGGSGADSSGGGIKGHLAREAFLRQVADLKSVAAKVQANAMNELGLTKAEPGLMRDFVHKRMPLADHRMLAHFAALASFGWEQGFQSNNLELQGFASRLLIFTEQAALDQGRIQLAYLLAGYPDPAPIGWNARRAPDLKSFSRLSPPQCLAANLAYLKHLDYAETRISSSPETGRCGRAPRRRGNRREASAPTAAPPPEASGCKFIGVRQGKCPWGTLGSQDSCFPNGAQGPISLPTFDPQSTDLIDALELTTLLLQGFYGSKTCLSWFARDSLSRPACIVKARALNTDLWPVPPPRWCWTACKPSGRRGRRRRTRLRLKAQVLQLVICALNWECLGHPKVAPDHARIGAPVSESQLRVIDLLESQIEHLLRVPAFVADDLGRAGKFSSFREVVEELPSDRLGTVDLLDWATAVHDSLLPYKGLRPGGPDRDLASRQDKDVCAPKRLSTFVAEALCRSSQTESSGSTDPLLIPRLTWTP